ncbi:alpha/beta hydrolase [Psychromonas sp. psych-6C06]|uniref:alpha/beta fold hydrolase n=1 Tax=Psychromonas sp. psych-6C06 TaxID=2058089 RepID=UPI000C31C572|nr:alpha/beta fold hydrolase [Psychromonas sp. psych-6C06]PKF60486.1 alpha/beta hydrolase [Psychromonas sp. psych-6C06]
MLLNYQIKQAFDIDADNKNEIIFLIHGLFGSLSNLSTLATELQAYAHIVLIDVRNHGKSPQSESMTYPEMVADIFALADHLEVQTFSIIGHSMGGKIAMGCALTHPERVKRLVVADIAPVNYADKHSEVFNGLLLLDVKKIKNRMQANEQLSRYIDSPEIRQFLLKSLHKKEQHFHFVFHLTALANNYQHIRNWPYEKSVFNAPTLFIKGGNSDYILPEHQKTIMQQFPNAQPKIIANTGHWLHAEKAKTFNRLVMQFFQERADIDAH